MTTLNEARSHERKGAGPHRREGRVLVVDDLHVSYGNGDDVALLVRSVSFDILRGETLAIVGESGCGKSITSFAVMGLLAPELRVSGRIVLGDGDAAIELDALRPSERRRLCGRRIGMIFQEPMTSLNPMRSAGDQIAEALLTHGLANRRDANIRAVEMLRQMGIPDPTRRASALPHELSGGMRQRVMIAMAMINEPDLLIADEPTTALDVTVQAQILDLIGGLARARGMATLFISHDLAVVANIADRVAVMYAGEIVETGPMDLVLRDPRHPYTQGLIASRPSLGGATRSRLLAIPGTVPEPSKRPGGCAFHPRCGQAILGQCDAAAIAPTEVAGRQVRCVRAHQGWPA